MSLPSQNNQTPTPFEALKGFSNFLAESNLSKVSIKNYLSDLRHFFSYLDHIDNNLENIYLNISKYSKEYQNSQTEMFTPTNTINRRLASIRRFTTYLQINIFNHLPSATNEIYQNTSHAPNIQNSGDNSKLNSHSPISSQKIVDQFQNHLKTEKKTKSTIKNYCSDLYHYFSWTAKHTPYNTLHLDQIPSKEQLDNYSSFLKINQTTTSVINRRQSSIKKLTAF